MRALPILTGATVLLLLAGCGSSSKSSMPSGKSSASTSPSSSAPSLSKADFIAQTNKVCSTENTKLAAIPTPSGSTDYAGVVSNLNGTLTEFKSYLQQVEALVPTSPDAAELQAKWIEPEKAEVTQIESAIGKMVADAQAKDGAKLQTDAAGLQAASQASTAIATYLKTYGLTECSNLEGN